MGVGVYALGVGVDCGYEGGGEGGGVEGWEEGVGGFWEGDDDDGGDDGGGRKRVEGGGVNQGWEKDVGKLGGWKIGVDDFYSKVACLALLCYGIENGVCEVCLVVGVCLGEGLCVRHERWEVCTFRRD